MSQDWLNVGGYAGLWVLLLYGLYGLYCLRERRRERRQRRRTWNLET